MKTQCVTTSWWTAPRLGTAAFAVLTNVALVRHVTSFQADVPVLFRSCFHEYYKSGTTTECPPLVIQDCTELIRDKPRTTPYSQLPHGRILRLAHVVGFSGDTSAAAALLCMWHNTTNIVHLEDVGDTASLRGNFHLIGWLLDHGDHIPSLTFDRIALWIRIAAWSGQLGVLTFLDQRFGHEFTRRGITNPCFE